MNENIVIVPHSFLSYIPFDILMYREAIIIHNHNLSYSHSEELTSYSNEELPPLTILGLSPEFNKACSSLEPLNFNQTEVENIHTLFSNNKLIHYTNMDIDSFKNSCKQGSVIHLATHAILNHTNSNKSYIALGADCKDSLASRLYLKDILGLDMNPELVVLSSCNSALGELIDGEGLTSLYKALFHSNTKSVLSTLWSVNDESTSIIMKSFYQNLKKGKPKDEALRHAKIKYLNQVDPAYAHPYYWAGIIAMGNMRPIINDSKRNQTLIGLGIIIVCGAMLYRYRRWQSAA